MRSLEAGPLALQIEQPANAEIHPVTQEQSPIRDKGQRGIRESAYNYLSIPKVISAK